MLDLDPAVGPPTGLVVAIRALGHDALQPLLAGGRQEGLAVSAHHVGRAPRRSLELERLERLATLFVGGAQQRAPVEPQQVEEHIGDGDLLHTSARRGLVGDVDPPLQALEAGQAALVEGHQLAVQDRAAVAQRARQALHLGVLRGHVGQGAALQAHAPGGAEGHCAHAVPLDLVGPAAALGVCG